nr:5427_t:CDS:2 [Entrophospora candida]
MNFCRPNSNTKKCNWCEVKSCDGCGGTGEVSNDEIDFSALGRKDVVNQRPGL